MKWHCQMKLPFGVCGAEGQSPLSLRIKNVKDKLDRRGKLLRGHNSEFEEAAKLLEETYACLSRAEEERNFYMALLENAKACSTCIAGRCRQCENQNMFRLAQYSDFDFTYGDDLE